MPAGAGGQREGSPSHLSAPLRQYERGLAEGELRFQRCLHCERAVFYPRVLCPFCGGRRLAWETSTGEGVVYSTTTVHAREQDPYNIVLIDLAEGFRMMSRVIGTPSQQVRIGERVIFAVAEGQGPVAVFRRAEEAG